MTNEDYERGRRDGLRMAMAVLSTEEAKWEALLAGSASWRTNRIRAVRHKTLQVAQSRLRTVLNKFAPRDTGTVPEEISGALEAICL